MDAEILWARGMVFVGKADSNHWTPMEAAPEFGGEGGAAKPLELLLIGLGGCTGMDVVSLLHKKRAPLTSLRMEIKAERATDHPRVLKSIHLVYYVGGPELKPGDAAEAVRLSQEKYCAVSAMLARSCPVTYEVKTE